MIGKMKTPQTDDLARGNHVVPTEWAEQLERERDEAREKYDDLATEHMLAVNKLAEERDEARAEISLKCQSVTIASGTISDLLKKSERLEKQIEGLNNFANERFDEIQRVRRERDEAREQNAKLRDIAGGLAAALERLDALYRSEQDPEAPMLRPDWLRRPLQMLDAELDRLKEGAK
jgi:chromosome segregation ATPase